MLEEPWVGTRAVACHSSGSLSEVLEVASAALCSIASNFYHRHREVIDVGDEGFELHERHRSEQSAQTECTPGRQVQRMHVDTLRNLGSDLVRA